MGEAKLFQAERTFKEGKEADTAGGGKEGGDWTGRSQRACGVPVASVLPSIPIQLADRQPGDSSRFVA